MREPPGREDSRANWLHPRMIYAPRVDLQQVALA
ncbi:MAG: hypothetical protein QOE13_1454 [Gaiellaceae bacterium]|jgi:hypothetical protein|nr:hypothetical protein [Gaiellaceae bacterium]